MNVCEYALYRHAGRLMTADEKAVAVELARMADSGDLEARHVLRQTVLRVLRDRERLKRIERAAAAA